MPDRTAILEKWITQAGRVVGLGLICLDGGLWAITMGAVFEPRLAYAGLMLFGLGDVVGGTIGGLFGKKSSK